MKKKFSKVGLFVLILILGIMLAGCGQAELDNSATESKTSFSGEYYDLKGTWEGFAYGHGVFDRANNSNDFIYMDSREAELTHYEFEIEEQKGRVFWGNKKVYFTDPAKTGEEKMMQEGFSGVFERDSNNFYIVEHDDGYAFGKVLSDGEIEIIYKENEETKQPRILIYELSRKN